MPTSGLLDAGSDPRQLCATMKLAAHLAQGQCLRLLPCAEAAMLRAQPQVAELLLGHRQPRSGVPRGKESGSSRGASAKITLNFFTKIDSEPDQAGIEFGKNMRSMGVDAEEVGKWVGGIAGRAGRWGTRLSFA